MRLFNLLKSMAQSIKSFKAGFCRTPYNINTDRTNSTNRIAAIKYVCDDLRSNGIYGGPGLYASMVAII